jgi:hypothetical protein
LPEYLDASHDIVIWEGKLDKRTTVYKAIVKDVEIKEFKLFQENSYKKAAAVFQMAKRDGKRAVEMLKEIELEQEPMLFFGSIASEAVKEYALRQESREKKVLRELFLTLTIPLSVTMSPFPTKKLWHIFAFLSQQDSNCA